MENINSKYNNMKKCIIKRALVLIMLFLSIGNIQSQGITLGDTIRIWNLFAIPNQQVFVEDTVGHKVDVVTLNVMSVYLKANYPEGVDSLFIRIGQVKDSSDFADIILKSNISSGSNCMTTTDTLVEVSCFLNRDLRVKIDKNIRLYSGSYWITVWCRDTLGRVSDKVYYQIKQ